MIETSKVVTSKNGMSRHTVQKKYVAEELTNITAEKKQAILDIISEGSQLTLLGLLVEQIGDKVALDTPEFAYAKTVYAEIKTILNG